VRDLIPFVHVSDLPGVDRFYELLGFEVGDTYEVAGELHWASLRNGDARIMLALAGAPIDPREQAVIFYLNVEDLDGLRERLLAHDLPVGPIRDGSPGPEREIRVSDPDGYCLMIAEEGGTARPADGTPKAYWINTFRSVRAPEKLDACVKLAGPVMREHGGRFLARGLPARAFEAGVVERAVVIEFESVERVVAAYESPGYQEALRVLGDGAERDLRIVEEAS
jgi:uncharacterized protein (DUF1330 family)